MNVIKIGFCVAYDWHLLKYALPLVYRKANVICLTLDKDRISWSGNQFPFDNLAFYQLIREIDHDKKIKIMEEDYHQPGLSPMQNEVRQRNKMADYLGEGGWHIQLDCDEYLIDFGQFVQYLERIPSYAQSKSNVCCPWLVLYKQLENGFLVVDAQEKEDLEFIQVATREPKYEYGRRNGNFNLYTPFPLLHQSWARPAEEVHTKILNWGHSRDFDGEKYFKFWDSLNEQNYVEAKNFHPVVPDQFKALKFVPSASVADLIENTNRVVHPRYSFFDLVLKNSKTLSRLRKLIGYL
jgi:hypothetical protein